MKGKNKSALMNEIANDLEENLEKFRDPVILGEMVYKLLEERENTNRILKNLLVRLEALERKVAQGSAPKQEVLLPEVDQQILDFVKSHGPVTAQDVQKAFKYKGRNAASSRLNRLYAQGLLQKKQVGRKVYFLLGKA